MHARIEFNYICFSRGKRVLKVFHQFEEQQVYKIDWEDIVSFKLPNCIRPKECLIWLKNNLYEVYKILDLEIPFDCIEWKFKRYSKNMGGNLYE